MTRKPFAWANEPSRQFQGRGYLEGQTTEERFWDIAMNAELILEIPGFAKKFYDYAGRGWYSLASPVLSNFGRHGLPISCNNSYIPDEIAGMMTKLAEIGMMTKNGAGTSGFFGDIRPRGSKIASGGKADGPVHFMNLFETQIDIVSQANIRRGNFAAYLPVEHPDIDEFLECREEGSSIQKLSLGITVTDKWLQEMRDGDAEKRRVWARVQRKRFETGFPYIVFHDTVNRNAPDVYRDKGMVIRGSNLCSEIALASALGESFVCDLGSMNLLYYDEWKDTDAVETYVFFLDAVMSEYIEKTKDMPHMEAAHRFAVNQRAIGLGSLGYHSALQAKMIPFESMEAKMLNVEMHRAIYEQAYAASQKLAEIYGEPPLLKGYGRRNVTVCAIAPTTSSSFILGQVSPSIEPLYSNYFTKNLAKGKFTYRNPYLDELLREYAVVFHVNDRNRQGIWVEDQWASILKHGGSVQHLDYLTEHEKAVFKTFGEISQLEIIQQAAARQKYLDQMQSINLMIHPKTPMKQVNELVLTAWELGVKSLYYQRSTNPAQEMVRNIMTCSSCEA
ncbi:ribonucleoside-diphosphate reductase subunit alpha [Epibacterium sp. MM17-32]|uniref:ribonucleoside-diphosphate reductase subunit alpha n=1 Tax=Epibacterium sp. MM17-32 TaxID=2917734 RepID=UPI001EF56D81|nr:ribonucleoside-diphosphate reductase subunit alpha [Epibacterium sp. MM17-32]MCG7628973.1 ribonucleoside-diphosphate reductase subunit alpha [Epibacterium sp. MM17-32]